MSSLLSSSSTKIIAGDVLSKRRFVRRRYVTRRRFVTETFCYRDVLLWRRFVRRRFVKETFCMCVLPSLVMDLRVLLPTVETGYKPCVYVSANCWGGGGWIGGVRVGGRTGFFQNS